MAANDLIYPSNFLCRENDAWLLAKHYIEPDMLQNGHALKKAWIEIQKPRWCTADGASAWAHRDD